MSLSSDGRIDQYDLEHLARCYSTQRNLQDALFEFWIDWCISQNIAWQAGQRIEAVLTSHPGVH